MSNNWFQFRQFMIQQEHAAMKVGTDGVLLGAWASLPGPGSRVLDIGTGTGLIALMMAQRTSDAEIDALEIDPLSAMQANENFRNSPWKQRIACILSSFQDYYPRCGSRYDLVICNPPFFSGSSKTPSREKNLARHDDSLGLGDLFKGSVTLMKEKGIISLVMPYDKQEPALELAEKHRLYCNRLTRVQPAPGKPIKRVLMEFSFVPGSCREDDLTIETGSRHAYSDKFKALVGDFYL
jgi:tRNA1Val (adenine37-N6)-methyltransferase